jgi:hypothetical protein
MKTIDEQLDEVREWHDSGATGNVIIFRSPHATKVDAIYEETIKMHELDTPTRALVEQVFELFDSERMEFFRDKNGYPDRVKIVRR